jgi:hypothetical protein
MKRRPPRRESAARATRFATGLPRHEPEAAGPMRPGHPHIDPRAGLAAVLAVTAAVHAPALGTFFAQDDVTYLARARGLVPIPWSLSRPLYDGVAWPALYPLFGLNPLLWHAFNLALHLLNVGLVYAVGRRLGLGPAAACAAALLFGVSGIAFTPLHWGVGSQELLVTALTLAAAWLFLVARARGWRAGLWIAALLGMAAALTKENAVLLPLALWVAHRRLSPPRPGARVLLPQAALSLLFVAAYAATLRFVHYIGTEAYARDFSPAFLLANASTYLRWAFSPHVPIRDFVAAADPTAWPIGIAIALAIAAGLWRVRRSPDHREEIGAAWCAVFLLPVLPLRYHTYLYYLYLPSIGLCWMLAGFAGRLLPRAPRPLAWAVGLGALLAAVAVGFVTGRAREGATIHGYPRDKTIREATILRHALEDLTRARLPAGARIAIVNPVRGRHFSLTSADTTMYDSARGRAYLPLEAALRGGEALRVFLPGRELVGFGSTIPRAWEEAEVFYYYGTAGHLEHLGRGSLALAMLGEMLLGLERWADARDLYQRTRARGDTLAPATFGLIIAEANLGDAERSRAQAQEFLRRWPDDPRAARVGEALRATTGAPALRMER